MGVVRKVESDIKHKHIRCLIFYFLPRGLFWGQNSKIFWVLFVWSGHVRQCWKRLSCPQEKTIFWRIEDIFKNAHLSVKNVSVFQLWKRQFSRHSIFLKLLKLPITGIFIKWVKLTIIDKHVVLDIRLYNI